MKKYEAPDLKMFLFETEDVLTGSTIVLPPIEFSVRSSRKADADTVQEQSRP